MGLSVVQMVIAYHKQYFDELDLTFVVKEFAEKFGLFCVQRLLYYIKLLIINT